jgi:hypothetical protein
MRLKIGMLFFGKNLNELAVTLSIRMSNVIGFTSDQGFDYPN